MTTTAQIARATLADVESLSAYLEVGSRLGRIFFVKHGYKPVGEPFELGDKGVLFWPMCRPGSAAPAAGEGSLR